MIYSYRELGFMWTLAVNTENVNIVSNYDSLIYSEKLA
nr:hypothetical protein [Mucilaginibacter sp. E4BP6]